MTSALGSVNPPAGTAREALGRKRPGGVPDDGAFPPRRVPSSWPATTLVRPEVMARVLAPPFVTAHPLTQHRYRCGLDAVLAWLSTQPGETWQARWTASGAEAQRGNGWRRSVMAWAGDPASAKDVSKPDFVAIGHGFSALIGADVIRPGLVWLLSPRTAHNLVAVMEATRDQEGFAMLRAATAADPTNVATKNTALRRIAVMVAAKGGTVGDITVGDCLELLEHLKNGAGPDTNASFYQLLVSLDVLETDAPPTARVWGAAGQQDIADLVDRHHIACRPIRDLLVDYLGERRARLDYNTLYDLAYGLAKLFWADLEAHHPGIDSLRLTPEVAAAWKRRVATTTKWAAPGAASRSRRSDGGFGYLAMVRAFYLDIAEWAAEDPVRWGPFAAPCPIRAEEMSRKKDRRRVKSAMDQRTRERLPVLPVLCATVDRARRDAAEVLEAALAVGPGEMFSVGEWTLRRSVLSRWTACAARTWAEDPDGGERRDLTQQEHRAFWTWAAVEVLRHTGIRIEELTELSHHSLVSYRLPTSGELVALLQIAPSKSDAERLLVISPELADVLAEIIARVSGVAGTVPLAVAYDIHERLWNPPMPLLFQHRSGMEHRPISPSTIRKLLATALKGTGLTDASGRPLRFVPHDFRRIFVTDALASGLPPHIAQVICGHQDINTTISYNTVYPDEVINAHRAFLVRRRSTRPSEEYRVPSDEEWQEFLGNFERRKVAFGTCGRAFATPCIHEHACLRCPMLWPDPAQRPRLVETIDNLAARIDEAHREGWRGEAEGLEATLGGARGKLTQIDNRCACPESVGPTVPEVRPVVMRRPAGRAR